MIFPKIFSVTCHTDRVGPGSTFVSIKGFKNDGHNFIREAIKKGATKIVCDKSVGNILIDPKIDYVFVENGRKSLAEFSSKAYDNPSLKLKIIGITGTKGKTTTTNLIYHILKSSGKRVALIGGIKNKIMDWEENSCLTTPNSDYLHAFFHECVKQNIEYVVMEVSSHSIDLKRVHGIKFDVVCFTNLGSDHMDYHKNVQNYFNSKFKLFDQIKDAGKAVINIDDDWGLFAFKLLNYKKIVSTLGMRNSLANCNFDIKDNSLDGLEVSINSKKLFLRSLFGKFNAYNAAMASFICEKAGIKWEDIKNSLKFFEGVSGRLQLHVLKNGAKTFVDFAHNPSSMESVLSELRNFTNHLIVVFGCGGDRDITKRPVMGRIASKYCDDIIITNDNPRSEDEIKIIDEIYEGVDLCKRKFAKKIVSRGEAIKEAVKISNKDSVIAILGKGHESYFLCNGEKKYFNDCEEIKQY